MTKHPAEALPTKGFTLVELLIGMGILSILLVGVISATITSSRMLYRIMAEADINQEIRFVEGQLGRDVRQALSVSMSGSDSLSIRTPNGNIDYFTKVNDDDQIELVREDQVGNSRHTILQDISSVQFNVPDYSVTVVELTIVAFIEVGTTADVERTYFSRFTSRVSRL